MMVAKRIDDDEMKEENSYVFGGENSDDEDEGDELEDEENDEGDGSGGRCRKRKRRHQELEQEQVHVNRRQADMSLHRVLYRHNNAELAHSEEQQKQVIDELRFEYAQHRWQCLYDAVEHDRLWTVCMAELDINRAAIHSILLDHNK